MKERNGGLFVVAFDVLLYDFTGSYLDGYAEKNPTMQRGYSRDHRPDRQQVVIALIVNAAEFFLSYETFDRNRTDVTTPEAVMRMGDRKEGRARRVWVFDRGIVSEENLAALRKRGGQYMVDTPRSKLSGVERELLEGGWVRVLDEVDAKLVPMHSGSPKACVGRQNGGKSNGQSTAVFRLRWSRR